MIFANKYEVRCGGVYPLMRFASLFFVLFSIVCLFSGCGTVHPEGDYRRTAALIAEHSGIESVYDPVTDCAVAEEVSKLLADGLTVEEAVRIALLNNRSFQSLFLEIGVSRADVVQSGLFTNPSLSLVPRFPDIGGRSNITAGFTQEAADLWQIPIRKKVALAQLERTMLQVVDSSVNLAAHAKSLYYRLLTQGESDRIARESLALVEQSCLLAQHRFDAGETTILDMNLVKSELVAARMALSTLHRDMQAAQADFASALGLGEFSAEWRLTERFPSRREEVADDTSLFTLAKEQRLDVQMTALDVRAAEKELVKQCRSVLPSLVFGLEMERTDHKAPTSRFERGMAAWDPSKDAQPSFPTAKEDALDASQVVDYLVGPSFQITLPIWDQNRAQIAKARLIVQQKRKNQEAGVLSIRAQVQKAAAAARCSVELLRAYEEDALPQAEQNHATARRVYEAGEESILALLQAQKTLIDIRDGHNQALGDYAEAIVELERAVGGRLVPLTEPKTKTP